MQDLEPHMEDLLRRAAEAYPLKEGEDKWNEIASKLSGNSLLPVSRKNWWQQNKYYLLLFPVLMSFSLLLNKYEVENRAVGHGQTITQDVNPVINNAEIKTKRITNHEVYNSTTTKNNKTTLQKINTNQRIAPNEVSIEEKSFIKTIPDRNSASVSDLTSSENTLLNGVLLDSSIAELKMSPPEKDPPKAMPHISGKGFYYGLIGGVHMNAIKDEGFKKTGFDVGLLGGYRFSGKISVESGILFARKYYWTSGKNFDMSGMGSMPAGMDMMEVHGSSQIIEIPFHVRYDFARKKTERFYSLAGFSSYILTEENNQYDYMLNGTQGKMSGSYEQNQTYFASCIDFALGYEKNVGYKTRLRIEPYIQLPVNGIGVGHLLVKSAGLRFGITNSLH
jgi:hypothetical protein